MAGSWPDQAAFASTYATPVTAITEGQTVTFTNLDAALHDIDSVNGSWGDTPLIGVGGSYTLTQAASLAPGQYGFYCSLHPRMTGTLIVR